MSDTIKDVEERKSGNECTTYNEFLDSTGFDDPDEESKSPLDTQVGGNHYKKFNIQPLEFLLANQDMIGYVEGNVIKYVCRHRFKNGVEDIDKAIHYLECLKEAEYAKESN